MADLNGPGQTSTGEGVVNESTWPLVLQEAEKAKELVSDKRTREEGKRLFDTLAEQYPSDGMVYFKRAEASEALLDLEKACVDYRKGGHFPHDVTTRLRLWMLRGTSTEGWPSG